MLMLEFVRWWYGRGWAGTLARIKDRTEELSDMFSVSILLRTLFSPWRRIITYPGAGLEAHMRALLDNLVSRLIGFFVRVIVLLSAAVMFVLLGLASVAEVALWPLLPLAAIGLLIWGIV